jgi:hypothetical protein
MAWASGVEWASGILAENEKPPSDSSNDKLTASIVLERVRVSASVPDRHNALLELKRLASSQPGVEIGNAIQLLLPILADTNDEETTHCVLEILDEICSVEPASDCDATVNAAMREVGLANTAEFLETNEAMEILLHTIAVEALWVRLAALSFLITLTKNIGEPVAQSILQCAVGMAKVMEAIADTREAVQSTAFHLLVLLTDSKGVGQASMEVANFVAFQDGFHVLLRVMTQEKLATDSPLVLDALRILMQMMASNQIVQKLFCTGEEVEGFLAVIASMLKPALARSSAITGGEMSLGEHIAAAAKNAASSVEDDEDDEGAMSGRSVQCSVDCVLICLQILQCLLENDCEQRRCQLGGSSFLVAAVAQLALAPTIPPTTSVGTLRVDRAVQWRAVQVASQLVTCNPKNAAAIATQYVLSAESSARTPANYEMLLELELEWRERELAAFYCCQEPSKMKTAHSLLRDYPFSDLRGSLHSKYSALPAGWGTLTAEGRMQDGMGRMQDHELQVVRGLFSLVVLWLHAPSADGEGQDGVLLLEGVWQLIMDLFSATTGVKDTVEGAAEDGCSGGCSWLAMVLLEEAICGENLIHQQPVQEATKEAVANTTPMTAGTGDGVSSGGDESPANGGEGSIRSAVGAYIGSNYLLSAAVGAAANVTKAGLEATSHLQPVAAAATQKAAATASTVGEKSRDLLSFGIGMGQAALGKASQENSADSTSQQPDASDGSGHPLSSSLSATKKSSSGDTAVESIWCGPWPLSTPLSAPCSGLLVIETLLNSCSSAGTKALGVGEEDTEPRCLSWQWQACRLLGAILSASGRVGRKLALQIETPRSLCDVSGELNCGQLFELIVRFLAEATASWKPIVPVVQRHVTNDQGGGEEDGGGKHESSSATSEQVSFLLLLCHWCGGSAEACYSLLRKPSHWYIVDIAAAGGTTSNLVSELACLLIGICWLELPESPAGVSTAVRADVDGDGCLHPTPELVRTAVENRVGMGAFTRRVELLPSSLRGWVGEGTAAEGAFSLCGQEVPLSATAHRVLALVISVMQYGANSNNPAPASETDLEAAAQVRLLREKNALLNAKVARLEAQQRKEPNRRERKARERRDSKEPKGRERKDSKERRDSKGMESKKGNGKGADGAAWWPEDSEGGSGKGVRKEKEAGDDRSNQRFTVTGLSNQTKPPKPPTHPASSSASAGEKDKDKGPKNELKESKKDKDKGPKNEPKESKKDKDKGPKNELKEDPTAFKGARKEKSKEAKKPKKADEESWWPEEETPKASGAKGRGGDSKGGRRR